MIDVLRNRPQRLVVQVVVSMALLVSLIALFNAPHASAAGAKTMLNTITVSGKGEVSITPDVTYIQFGLITEGKTAQEAQQKNGALFAKIQEAIQKQGVVEADIRTARYNTYPEYRWENEQNTLKGYRSEHIVEVTYREMDAIGSLLDAVSNAGVNRIDNIQFSTEKMDEYEIVALQNAVANARNKAEALARTLGKSVKDIVAIQESGTAAPLVFYREEAMMKSSGAAQDASTTINLGQLTITSHVQVTYEF